MFGQNVRKSLFVLDISAAQLGAVMCGRDKSSSPNISNTRIVRAYESGIEAPIAVDAGGLLFIV